MPLHDYLIAIYFIVAFVLLLTVAIAASLIISFHLQRRRIERLQQEIEVIKKRLEASRGYLPGGVPDPVVGAQGENSRRCS